MNGIPHYNYLSVVHNFTDSKLRTYARWGVISETLRIFMPDMQVFGTIANLASQGAVNIPIEENTLTYEGEPVVFIMAYCNKKLGYISFHIFTKYTGYMGA